MMGSPESESQRDPDEKQHEVTLSPFYIAPHEVSQESYLEVMGANPSTHKGSNLPMGNVTWYEAGVAKLQL